MPSRSKTNPRRSTRPNRVDPLLAPIRGSNKPAESSEKDWKTDGKRKQLPSLYSVTKLTSKAWKDVASAKKAAGKWKHYVTTKRRLDESVLNKKPTTSYMLYVNGDQYADVDEQAETSAAASEMKNSSAKNGQGLDDIHENFTKMTGKKLPTAASNRALIQHFAKLGQSMRSDELLDLDFIEGLLNQGADINCTDIYGQTILHEVARTWHTDVGKFVLEHGGNINVADSFGRTPLHVASAVDYAEMCEFLIRNGADREAVTKGENQTPLFYAARNDATNALAALIKHNCEFKEVRDYRGRTPLYVAAELDRSETARYLLEHRAPVGVVDNTGQPALTWMINKMAPVAKEALDQLHTCDRANRKQYFYLNHLEPLQPDENRDGHAQMPLEVLVQIKNFDLILHPVIGEQISIKWDKFGKFGAWWLIVLQLFFMALWTTIALHSPWYSKCHYELPTDIWKIVIYVLAVGLTIYQIVDELRDFISSQSDHRKWKAWRIQQIDEDIAYCHPRWPEEKIFLENEKNDLDKFQSNYFQDFWNIFDWICYVFLLASTITHIIDLTLPSLVVAQMHNRIMSINIIFVWMRTMKYVRCFSLLGPFIVMIGEMVGDMIKFAFLYVIFLVPYSFAFWMVFGGDHTAIANSTMSDATCIAANLKGPASDLLTIGGMDQFDELFFTMYRLTLVDEYPLDNLLEKDKVMTYILLGSWFWISAILCLNLFIALLSDTFQRVYDNARANAVMQKAITVLTIEDKLMKSKLREYREHIRTKCSPEVVYYDDDTGEGGDELKKVTIQTKERLDTLLEMWTAKYGTPTQDDDGQNYYEEGDDSDGDEDGGDSGKPPGDGKLNVSLKGLVTVEKLENEVDILRAELTQVEKKRRDFERKCLNELTTVRQLLSANFSANAAAEQSQTPPVLPEYDHVPAAELNDLHTSSPPTYPAAIGERMTPRGDQLRSDASASHIDIATLPPPTGEAAQASPSFGPVLRLQSLAEPSASPEGDDTTDV